VFHHGVAKRGRDQAVQRGHPHHAHDRHRHRPGHRTGQAFYINSQKESVHYQPVRVNRSRLALLSSLLASFFCGGTAGALGFNYVGYASTIPLAVFLVFLAVAPLVDDARLRFRAFTRYRMH